MRDESLNEHEKALVADKRLIIAIKSVRERLGLGLKEAKDIVDTYRHNTDSGIVSLKERASDLQAWLKKRGLVLRAENYIELAHSKECNEDPECLSIIVGKDYGEVSFP